MQVCLSPSPCALVRDPTWIMSARSRWLHHTLALSLNHSCQGPLILYPRVPETEAPCAGENYRRPWPLPAPVAFRESSERPLHDHG
ncbi:hypothetical protein VZT92_005681 [Zoarces viviparus]|uniref:Uncharacterized protein n=1 Tax=Zoarces viviparus TaxID=48416 RepID=A0AAW1FTZ1_ZOAVI